ncbi:DUF6896 domain-containing protein [Hymenobacter volaticus]|uniref:DUF6896 domain-containing protein n=1 Tax=Hymenobacter volaticus TaxID=2932254 RepID=A0ABY4GDI6_9BACT|nr:hypothetical protein [Hymenobacter volaticus]UOQ68985.1 hypothetical protein MUN86_26125 [Hymenobacter volaticus]
MPAVKQQVVALLHEYQAAVYQAVALLNAKSEQEKGFQRPEVSPGVRAGYLDALQQVRYHFHGAGCKITTPAFTVDFDYARDGGCSGIDLWFLVDFLESNPAIQAKYPFLTNGEQVEQVLEELVKEGLLTRYWYSGTMGVFI